MKNLSKRMLFLQGGVLMSIFLSQGVYGRTMETKLHDDTVAEDADEKKIHSEQLIMAKSREKRDGGMSAAAIAILTSAISAGSTLTGTTIATLMNTGHTVVVGIEIDNFSKWLLYRGQSINNGGHISIPAGHVQPARREAVVAHKTSGTATGTYGTVSWLVNNGRGNRIIVMWSVPYDHNYHHNWLGVGIIPDEGDGNHWYNQMYYETGPFVRREYYRNSRSIEYCDNDMCIYGTMGTSYKPKVKISFYPKRTDDLAPNVRAAATAQ